MLWNAIRSLRGWQFTMRAMVMVVDAELFGLRRV